MTTSAQTQTQTQPQTGKPAAQPPSSLPAAMARPPRSLWRDAWSRLLRNKAAARSSRRVTNTPNV